MLKPAQLYEEQLKEAALNEWYKPENIYYGGVGNININVRPDNDDVHQFASVDEYGNVLGYICYNVDWVTMNAYEFGVMSFKRGSVTFLRDVYQAICDIFEKYHMNRFSFSCMADNPVLRGYRRFIKKHGGRECAYFRQIAKLQDGKVHDSIYFEILAEEFNKWKVTV